MMEARRLAARPCRESPARGPPNPFAALMTQAAAQDLMKPKLEAEALVKEKAA